MTKIVVELTSNTSGSTETSNTITSGERAKELKGHVQDDAEPAENINVVDANLEVESIRSPETQPKKKNLKAVPVQSGLMDAERGESSSGTYRSPVKKARRKACEQVKKDQASNKYTVDANLEEEALMSPEKRTERQQKKRQNSTVVKVQIGSTESHKSKVKKSLRVTTQIEMSADDGAISTDQVDIRLQPMNKDGGADTNGADEEAGDQIQLFDLANGDPNQEEEEEEEEEEEDDETNMARFDANEHTVWIDSDGDEETEKIILKQNFFLPYSDHNYDPPDPSERVIHPEEGPFPIIRGLSEDGRIIRQYMPPGYEDQGEEVGVPDEEELAERAETVASAAQEAHVVLTSVTQKAPTAPTAPIPSHSTTSVPKNSTSQQQNPLQKALTDELKGNLNRRPTSAGSNGNGIPLHRNGVSQVNQPINQQPLPSQVVPTNQAPKLGQPQQVNTAPIANSDIGMTRPRQASSIGNHNKNRVNGRGAPASIAPTSAAHASPSRANAASSSRNPTWKDFTRVAGIECSYTRLSKLPTFADCCREKYNEDGSAISQNCTCAYFEACLNMDNFYTTEKLKMAYFMEVGDNQHVCMSCHGRTGCQMPPKPRSTSTQLSVQNAAAHLKVCKKRSAGRTANCFIFRWSEEGVLYANNQFNKNGGRFDFRRFDALLPRQDVVSEGSTSLVDFDSSNDGHKTDYDD